MPKVSPCRTLFSSLDHWPLVPLPLMLNSRIEVPNVCRECWNSAASSLASKGGFQSSPVVVEVPSSGGCVSQPVVLTPINARGSRSAPIAYRRKAKAVYDQQKSIAGNSCLQPAQDISGVPVDSSALQPVQVRDGSVPDHVVFDSDPSGEPSHSAATSSSVSDSIVLPENVEFLGQKIDLTPIKGLLTSVQDTASSVAKTISS
ncbi:hypothetical protein V6N11_025789 [Hibiscus sabdariffa]|uniref:Uncharacterized protein n=1 Tax=Hibiscus sabdariffa TaxID=183260 RepID=A0ABR2SU02_9ROSI